VTIHGEFDELLYQDPSLAKAIHEWASKVFTCDVDSNAEPAFEVRWLAAQESVHVAVRELILTSWHCAADGSGNDRVVALPCPEIS
jgi:hypothetical protein